MTGNSFLKGCWWFNFRFGTTFSFRL